MCPIDQQHAYRAPDNRIYDASGQFLGYMGQVAFQPQRGVPVTNVRVYAADAPRPLSVYERMQDEPVTVV